MKTLLTLLVVSCGLLLPAAQAETSSTTPTIQRTQDLSHHHHRHHHRHHHKHHNH